MKKEKEIVAATATPPVSAAPHEYFRLVRTDRNMFSVETVCVVDGRIVSTTASEPTYLPIAFDRLRRKTGESFFAAVEQESR